MKVQGAQDEDYLAHREHVERKLQELAELSLEDPSAIKEYLQLWIAEYRVIDKIKTADWEDGPGDHVGWTTKMRAATLLLEIKRQAGSTWAKAAVSATPDGGVHLSWHVGGNHATLTIPDGAASVIGIRKLSPSPSCREVLTDSAKAVAFVLPAFTTYTSEARTPGRMETESDTPRPRLSPPPCHTSAPRADCHRGADRGHRRLV